MTTVIHIDPDCTCEHQRLRHAADMGFCYDCQCKLYHPAKADEISPEFRSIIAALAPNTEGEQQEDPVLCGSCFFDNHDCQGVALCDMNVKLGTLTCECPTCRPAPSDRQEG